MTTFVKWLQDDLMIFKMERKKVGGLEERKNARWIVAVLCYCSQRTEGATAWCVLAVFRSFPFLQSDLPALSSEHKKAALSVVGFVLCIEPHEYFIYVSCKQHCVVSLLTLSFFLF